MPKSLKTSSIIIENLSLVSSQNNQLDLLKIANYIYNLQYSK